MTKVTLKMENFETKIKWKKWQTIANEKTSEGKEYSAPLSITFEKKHFIYTKFQIKLYFWCLERYKKFVRINLTEV